MSGFLNLPKLSREMWFAARIAERPGGRFRCRIFEGATTPAIRAERCRAAILEHDLTAQRVVPSRPDSFADCFERLYAQPLAAPRETSQHQLALGVA